MRPLVPVLLSLLLPSCASPGATPREIDIPDHPASELWTAVVDYVKSRRLRPDPAETDVGYRRFVTKWRGGSYSFRRGSRWRMYAQVVRSRVTDDGWAIEYYFEVQQVTDFTKSMRPEESDWEYAGQDGQKEQDFYTVMVARFNLDKDSATE